MEYRISISLSVLKNKNTGIREKRFREKIDVQ